MTVTVSKITAPTIAVTGSYYTATWTQMSNPPRQNLKTTSVSNLVVNNQTPRVSSGTGHGLLVYGTTKNFGTNGKFFGADGAGSPFAGIPLFAAGMRITLSTIYAQSKYSYATKATQPDFMGALNVSGLSANVNAQIYYSFDGKDPIRTKSILYTNSFVLNKNKTSSNTTVIKARVYYDGKKSDVVKFEFRIQE